MRDRLRHIVSCPDLKRTGGNRCHDRQFSRRRDRNGSKPGLFQGAFANNPSEGHLLIRGDIERDSRPIVRRDRTGERAARREVQAASRRDRTRTRHGCDGQRGNPTDRERPIDAERPFPFDRCKRDDFSAGNRERRPVRNGQCACALRKDRQVAGRQQRHLLRRDGAVQNEDIVHDTLPVAVVRSGAEASSNREIRQIDRHLRRHVLGDKRAVQIDATPWQRRIVRNDDVMPRAVPDIVVDGRFANKRRAVARKVIPPVVVEIAISRRVGGLLAGACRAQAVQPSLRRAPPGIDSVLAALHVLVLHTHGHGEGGIAGRERRCGRRCELGGGKRIQHQDIDVRSPRKRHGVRSGVRQVIPCRFSLARHQPIAVAR